MSWDGTLSATIMTGDRGLARGELSGCCLDFGFIASAEGRVARSALIAAVSFWIFDNLSESFLTMGKISSFAA